MPPSPTSSDLSEPPSLESDAEDRSSRPSADIDQVPPPSKRRKTSRSTLSRLDVAPSSPTAVDNDDDISISSDGYSSAPGSPSHDEWHLHEEAQKQCLWKDCDYGEAPNNDELVKHVQSAHCATSGPKKTKYTCEWGECQRKTSNHPSGYALKAHMRSHTKEKPYYCALPECDKAFTRSDALAKHMRTVHEPEPARIVPASANNNNNDPTPPGKKSIKLKLTNGNSSTPKLSDVEMPVPTHDEDGNPVAQSLPNDNISYTPAFHPITGQQGFLITYPPDIDFTRAESSLSADQLVRVLRRQLHWAEQETSDLLADCDQLEARRKEEWLLKENLLTAFMRAELARGEKEGILSNVDDAVRRAMYQDVQLDIAPELKREMTPQPQLSRDKSLSPPPTGHSGGFDGDAEPFDNYYQSLMTRYAERERERERNTPIKKKASMSEGRRESGGGGEEGEDVGVEIGGEEGDGVA